MRISAAEQFGKLVRHYQQVNGDDFDTAWAKARVADWPLYEAMEAGQAAPEGYGLANEATPGAGPMDAMIPDWAYRLLGVDRKTYADFRAALVEKEFPSERAPHLLQACAEFLKREQSLSHIDAWLALRNLLPEIYSQEDARKARNYQAYGVSTTGTKAGKPTAETIDDGRGDFVVSLLPAWVRGVLEAPEGSSDLTLEQRMNRNSVTLTPDQAQRALAAMTEALMRRQGISREAAKAKLNTKAYYFNRFAQPGGGGLVTSGARGGAGAVGLANIRENWETI